MNKRFFVIGGGAVGTSLGLALSKAGWTLLGIYDIDPVRARQAADRARCPAFGGGLPEVQMEASVVLVTVPDRQIPKVAELARAEGLVAGEQVWVHCSGHLGADSLSAVASSVKGCAAMHPAFVFPPGQCTGIPSGTFFSVGGDEDGVAVVKMMVADLGGEVVKVAPEKRHQYHAAMVMGSNYVAALLAAARQTLFECGIEANRIDPMLFSLVESGVSRMRALGIDHSLSGPVRRGDVRVVEDHLAALSSNEELLALYVALGKATVKMAAAQPGYCQDTAAVLNRLLSGATGSA